MKSGVPWQVKVRPEARESAREAARRSGMSVGEWLDTVIIDSASNEGVDPAPYARPQPDPDEHADWDRDPQPQRRKYAEYDDRHRPPVRPDRHQPAAYDQPDRLPQDEHVRPAADPGIAEVNHRLDNLTRQLDQLAKLNAARAERAAGRPDETPRQLTDVISKLDRSLDKLITEGRSATSEIERRMNAVDRAVADLGRETPRPAVAANPPTPLDQALMEIADRQRALDGYAPVPAAAHAPMPSDPLPRARTQEFSGLERELRQINTQIETLSRPCSIDKAVGKAVDTLRDDLAEIGVMLQEAMPRKAVEALEGEVRKLTDRIDHTRHAGTDGAAVAGVERGLAEVRDALRALTPAENLVGFDKAVKELSRKIDLIAGNSQDPAALKQLEGAIVAMRGIVSHVASNDALAKLSEEVRSLADKVDHATAGGGSDVLSSLERRIGSLADALEARNRNGQDVPRELETVVTGLIDKIERIQLTRGDHMALGHLEDRIAKLVEKLDASDARLNHLEAIERGLAELLIHLEHQRVPHLARAAAGPPPEVDALHRDVDDLRQTDRKTQDSLEAVHGTLGHVVDRLAMIETDMRGKTTQAPAAPARPPAPAAAPKAAAAAAQVELPVAPTIPPPPALAVDITEPIGEVAAPGPAVAAPSPAKSVPAVTAERQPIDPNLPPDHPLEPGSGVTRGRHPSSPADRIAASEAALGPAKPPVIPDPGGKSNFIAAARRAAQAAVGDGPARGGARPADPAARGLKGSKLASLLRRHARSLIVGLSVVSIVLGSLHMAATWLGSSDEPETGSASRVGETTTPTAEPPASAPASQAPAAPAPAKPPAGRQSALGPALDRSPAGAPAPGVLLAIETARQAMSASAPKAATAAASPERDLTGSVSLPAKPATTPGPAPAARAPAAPIQIAPAQVVPTQVVPAQAAPSQVAPAAAALAPVVPAHSAAGPASMGGDKLPATIGSALRAAAAKGDPAAQFEIAQRYAEGRGMPQSFVEAAEWFERAAKQGLVPAHFRLGGLHEKGLGVKKNLDAARRYYLTAGEAGNAKAMHNLAVLYAEGIDGKPDFLTAARWFRKAAGFGVADSQYNLGILYARGIGVEQNLAEAYKWFALAAREGDRESAKKRDDLGARLDEQSLKAVQAAVQTWAPEPQPEAATQVKTPAGGWDATAATPPAPKRKPPVVGPKLDLSIPRPAQ